MRIVVCVKQVPASNETRLDPVTHTLMREGAANILNPFDAYAVEEALRLKERYGGRVTALSMGIPSVAGMLRQVVALGADDAALLSDRAFAGSDTMATAYALSQGIRKLGGAELILCGKMASDGDTAQVGPMLAQRLGWPQITDVAAIEEISGGFVTARKLTDEGYRRVRVPLPALLTVVKEINVPRLPSIAGVLRGEQAQVTVLSAADVQADSTRVGLNGSYTRVVKSERPDRTVRTERLNGTPQQQAAALLGRLWQEGAIDRE